MLITRRIFNRIALMTAGAKVFLLDRSASGFAQSQIALQPLTAPANRVVEALQVIGGPPSATNPVEFGRNELDRCFSAAGIRPVALTTSVGVGTPESFTIQLGNPAKITGGDERGLMYGLLEAAEQVRNHGRLSPASGSPQTSMRGIRYHISDESDWHDREYWDEYFRMLAYNRFNRFNLLYSSYYALVELPEFPEVRISAIGPDQREHNLQMLQYISKAAEAHGIDFTLGIWSASLHGVEGLTQQNLGPYTYTGLKKVLQLCPAIRSVQVRTDWESGIPLAEQVGFYNNYFYRAIREAGRPIILELRAWLLAPGMLDVAEHSGLPLRVSAKYWCEFMGRPYQPAETYAEFSYLDLLQKPRPYQFYWELWGGSNRLLLWGNPDFVRRTVSTFGLGDGIGFEIDPPVALRRPGPEREELGVFAPNQQQRVFWNWEYQRYWLFYMLWGRLSYDPKTPESIWHQELTKRFGSAAEDVLRAYDQSSRVINEVVAAHLADPDVDIWPELNPGGLIDDYIDVLPSDWRYIASIAEAVQNCLEFKASAKQTPEQTSKLLDSIAFDIQAAITRAGKKIGENNKEWNSSEPDFTVLGLLARYHARKMLAAYHLEFFYKSGDGAALDSAKSEAQQALTIWESLARFGDGVYPQQMNYGGYDIGTWKDKLAYVRHDVQAVTDREDIFKRFGRFRIGFDFGAPVAEPQTLVGRPTWPFRNTHYVLENNVEPRFIPVDPATIYQERTGFGWVGEGPRQATGISNSPYQEIRTISATPQNLPNDVLFRDYISGEGTQVFRVKMESGEYTAIFLNPDRTQTSVKLSTDGGSLLIPFPEGKWSISGLVIQGRNTRERFPEAKPATPEPRPALSHVPPRIARADQPLRVSLQISSVTDITAVRLYYRPVDQLATFKMLEAEPAHVSFTIPAADISSKYDLMYYFEVLTNQHRGWFIPDPLLETPYYVLQVKSAS